MTTNKRYYGPRRDVEETAEEIMRAMRLREENRKRTERAVAAQREAIRRSLR